MTSPLISVLMPVYNAEKYLAEAVESILAQTFTDFEFIVIDDGSTDGSPAILKKYAAEDSRIRIISRPNTGYLIALNEMLGVARGEFIARMDADDISMPMRFECQVKFLQCHFQHAVIGSQVDLIDADGDFIGRYELPIDHEGIDRRSMDGLAGIIHPAMMYRRDIVIRIGGYRHKVEGTEDVDLLLRLAEMDNGKLANLADTLLYYRLHANSVTHFFSGRAHFTNRIAVQDAFLRRGLGEPPAEASIDSKKTLTPWDCYLRWTWVALGYGNIAIARKYAKRALLAKPFSLDSWRAAFCVIRGY